MRADSDEIAISNSATARSVVASPTSCAAIAGESEACTGKIVVIGAGTSGAVARRLAHLLSVCGTAAFYLNPSDGLHGSLGAVGTGDVVIAISKGGESTEINEFIRRATTRGASTVALTAVLDSELAECVNIAVRIDSASADPGNVIAMGSTLATSAWGDALAVALMRHRQYAWADVLYSHPGGAFGRHSEELLAGVGDPHREG
ncbi:SIS domain-containing protein [Oerskovia enterophila]|uniref:SIS domain-containing protein n=1 Tax=Oerskovia enterophila TaxID=43678 RepID=UPI00339AA6AD